METYQAIYADRHGSENTVILNYGDKLHISLRGVEFSGRDFGSLEPQGCISDNGLESFTLSQNQLCSCRIECKIPVTVCKLQNEIDGLLSVELTLGDPVHNGGIDREILKLTLAFDQTCYVSSGKRGYFEDKLLEIQSQLPSGTFMKTCINCLYSDYSPYGNGLFGTMMCFKNLKNEYLKVTSKDEFWSVHDRFDRLVQETYLCPEFSRRVPGTGYRG
jgi:hypothetical protein